MTDGLEFEGVQNVEGEMWTFKVPSRTRGNTIHHVVLDEYGWNGRCDCERFRFKMQSHLENGAKPQSRFQCHHIVAATRFAFLQVGPKLKAAVEAQQKSRMFGTKFAKAERPAELQRKPYFLKR